MILAGQYAGARFRGMCAFVVMCKQASRYESRAWVGSATLTKVVNGIFRAILSHF